MSVCVHENRQNKKTRSRRGLCNILLIKKMSKFTKIIMICVDNLALYTYIF